MKTTGIKLCAGLLALCCIACTEAPEEEFFKGMTISAITESAPTKTALEGSDETGYDVVWTEKDSIKVQFQNPGIVTTDFIKFTLTSGDGTTTGEFSNDKVIDLSPVTQYEAYYGIEDNLWPTEQTYQGEGVISNAPMYATGTVEDGIPDCLKFKNLGGILRLTVKGSSAIKRIWIYANEYMSGAIGSIVNNSAQISNKQRKYISLDLGPSGVTPDENGTDFYIAMPERTAEMGGYTGVSIDFDFFNGTYITKSLSKPLIINRAQITPATVSGIDMDYLLWLKRTPYGEFTREFHAGDNVSVFSNGEYGTFIANNDGQTALFSGKSQLVQAEDAIVVYSGNGVREEYRPFVSIPSSQRIEDGGMDASAEIAAGKVDLNSTKSSPVELQNLCAAVYFEVDQPVKKVVFKNSSTLVFAASDLRVKWNDATSEWYLDWNDYGTETDKITVTSALEGESFTKGYILVKPCSSERGYVLDCYDSLDSDKPAFSLSKTSRVEFVAGQVTTVKHEETPQPVLYVCYNVLDEDFVYIKGNKIDSSKDPLKECTSYPGFIQGLDIDYSSGDNYPAPGQKCDLHIFFGGQPLYGLPTINHKTTIKTGERALVGDTWCDEYVLKDFVVPDNKGKAQKAHIFINYYFDIDVDLPYCWPSEPASIDNLSPYLWIHSDDNIFVRNSGKDYDRFLLSNDFNLTDCKWRVQKVGDKVRLYQSMNDKTYWLQFQDYRPIGYVSKDASGLEFWGNWFIGENGVIYNRGAIIYSDDGNTLKATGDWDVQGFSLYKMKNIR